MILNFTDCCLRRTLNLLLLFNNCLCELIGGSCPYQKIINIGRIFCDIILLLNECEYIKITNK